jgi:hypothetical protein
VLVSSCFRRFGGFAVFSLALALVAPPSARAALAGGYSPQPMGGVSMPVPTTASDSFGTNMVNAGGLILVGVPDANNGNGAVVFVNPFSGQTRRIDYPQQVNNQGKPVEFGASVAVIPDVGKCQSAPSQRAGYCRLGSDPTHTPDYLVGAPGADISSSAQDMGIVYVMDGDPSDNDGVMNSIALTGADGQPAAGVPDFGRSVSSAAGMPPCLGSGSIGACPSLYSSVASGDLDGDGVPDIAIGAPSYQETNDTDPKACPTVAPCAPTGRLYVIKGSALLVPHVPTPDQHVDASVSANLVFGDALKYPYPAETSNPPNFGGSVQPLGDVGYCDTTDLPVGATTCPLDHVRNSPDGVPDLLVSATGADTGATDGGAAFVIDGKSAIVLSRLDGGTPGAGFGAFSSGELAFGDLVDTALPDIFVTATGVGEGYVFTGDATFPQSSRLWADTGPHGPGFGASSAPAGDIGGDSPGEILIGDTASSAIHVFSACANQIVQTIPAPAGAGGFGASVVSVGDVNGDGYPDFAAGAPSAAGGEGRVFVMVSNGAPGPGVVACHSDGGGGGGSVGPGGGGGGTTPPPSPRRRVRALAVRKLSFSASKKTVKAGKPISLSGRLRAAKRRATCQSRQKVAIQRLVMSTPNAQWTTIDVAKTNKKGKFRTITTPAPANTTFGYRARVNRTKRCAAAFSNRVKVRATG